MKGNWFAYSVFRFSATPGAGRAAFLAEPARVLNIFQSGRLFASLFSSRIPVNESKRKNRLKTKCALNPMFLSTPPQLQGTRSNTPKSTSAIYAVKTSIKSADAYSPGNLNLGTKSRMTTANSVIGISHSSAGTDQSGRAWLLNSLSKR